MMMRARKAMIYDGRNLTAGEVFDCLAHDEPVLVAADLAEPFYGDNPTALLRNKPKRRYRRRDLRAEE